MLVSPPHGWQNFNHSKNLLEFINSHLTVKEKDGIWQFYQFSDNNIAWCSDETRATNQLQIKFESDGSNAIISSLGVEMTNNASQYFKQLFKLKKALKTKFAIRNTI